MVIDISQELFHCRVFPGDPAPSFTRLSSTDKGDLCNLTALSLCAHNGTHVDAPFHFIPEGKTVDRIAPEVFVGPAYVACFDGVLDAADAARVLADAHTAGAGARILLRGNATVSAAAARTFAADAGLKLLGNESQTFGPPEAPAEVHRILLGADIVLLEGICLDAAAEGRYLLCAAPLKLGGCDGAPCRAVLLTED